MLDITYICQNCHKQPPEGYTSMICPRCKGDLRGEGFPSLTGTRDNFGIKREFYDPKTGKYIDNFKSWEKAGFKDPLEIKTKNSEHVKERIKYFKKNKNYQTKSKALNYAERI